MKGKKMAKFEKEVGGKDVSGGDPAKHGFRKIPFGPNEKDDHMIDNAAQKGAKADAGKGSNIHDIAKHLSHGKIFSHRHSFKEKDGADES